MNNLSPRLSVAWSPSFSDGFLGKLTGNGKMVIRGGYSLVYDRIGQALAVTFSDNSAYGLSTSLSSPVNLVNEDTPGVRFVDEKTLPPTVPPAPKGGFPATPESGSGSIYSSLDDTITTPYSHVVNVAVGRELRNNFSVEAAFVGRFGRNLLVRRDLAQMVNLVDPEERRGLLHGCQGGDPGGAEPGHSGRRGDRRVRRRPGHPVLGEPVPRCRVRRLHRHAAYRPRVQSLRAGLPDGHLGDGPVLLARVQHLRPVHLLQQPVRRAGGAELGGARRLPRRFSSRSASAGARATSSTSTTRCRNPRTTVRTSSAVPRGATPGTAVTRGS